MKTLARSIVATAILGSSTTAQVTPGIDVLAERKFDIVRGASVGLITNHTGRSQSGATSVSVFAGTEACRLVALFSPEHGFTGALDQAEIDDSTDPTTGVVIHSLYGETRVPTAEMLAGVDVLVFDIQDIGTRFYTYISTMKGAMEAAASQDVRFVVLDRPNPIGGTAVRGPVLDDGTQSFVGCHTLPVQHGMTVGELAEMLRAECSIDVRLEVVRCAGWRRDDAFDRTGLLWVNPSPNIRSLNQALLYPGVGLLEMTNVSVGRGTDAPFETFGAPWIDHLALAVRLGRELDAVGVVPIEFEPTSSKFAGERCRGLQFSIRSRARLDAVELGIRLACALRTQHESEWDTERLPRLLCDRQVVAAIRRGAKADEVLAIWANELAEFERRRARFLLY